MHCISFDIFRTLGLPNTRVLKPEQVFSHKDALTRADWVLFPPYWQLNALLYGLNCRIFPSEASYRIGHDKVEMTRAFELIAPEHTPRTLIAANLAAEQERLWQALPRPFVAKRPKASMGQGVWLIHTEQQWRDYCEQTDVLYVQEYLPIDRDLRVVIVGERILTAYWRRQAEQGFYNNVAQGGYIEYGNVPEAALALVRRVATGLGINHAGFDIAVVDGHPYLIEFNRLFGNQGLRQGSELRDAMLSYLEGTDRPGPGDNPPPHPLKDVG